MMSWTRLLTRSLAYHLRIHGAVALGVAAATAVLTGALLVGDSVRGSLRDLALDQLGKVDEMVLADRFFREQLADELEASETFQQDYASATPVILFPLAAVESQAESTRRASQILAIGCDQRFWELGEAEAPTLEYDQVVLNEPLADELEVEVGDRVIVRLPKAAEIPAESTLARKTDRVRSLAGMEVVKILPAAGLGRFSLRPNQSAPRNVYLPLVQLQDALEEEGQVNTLLISSGNPLPPDERASRRLADALRPQFEDYGLTLEEARQVWTEDGQPREAFLYWSVSSNRMVFDPQTDEALAAALGPLNAQPVMTYMVNTIALDGEPEGGIPYSIASGVDPSAAFPMADVDGRSIQSLEDDEVVLHQWTAEQLGAEVGDVISLQYFAPESTHGSPDELEELLTVRAIAPLTTPAEPYDGETPAVYEQPPTSFNDPFFTPTVEGITDQDTIDNWDPPFPYDRTRVKQRDDEYWENYRTTPKAFVSLETARRLWGSRFGETTSYRVPADEAGAEAIREAVAAELHARGNRPGFDPAPVKREALQAASGTTPFDVLFMSLSLFIIAAALILVSLLFQLGVEQRAEEAGTLLALGMSRRRTARLLSAEGAVVAAAGAVLGVALGVGYAKLMVTGLSHWWVDAITTPFLELHVTGRSLAIGYVLGVAVSVATIALRLRRMRKLSIRRLLAGEATEELGPRGRSRARWDALAAAAAAAAVGLGLAASKMPGGEAQAGGFVGSGALILTALLLAVWNRLRGSRTGSVASVPALASRNASRNPVRSTLVIGLMAVASFLIVAMSAFRLAPSLEGSGGFALVGQSSLPVFADLNSPEDRYDLFADPSVMDDTVVLSLRVKPGDDASCRNLYQSTRPQVLGVTDQLIDYYDQPREAPFRWAASAAESPQQQQNPWRLLRDDPGRGRPVPAVLDKNTAMYSLHLYRGIGETFTVEYDDGRKVEFQVVGLLANSVLQGAVLIGERSFQRLFPEVGGYRYFLAGRPGSREGAITQAMEQALSDQGLDLRPAEELLRELLSVQNTYLSTFQSLGLLGLLLGTFGLATVQVRSVLERRKELALMRAAGFRRSRIAWMVLLENLVLLMLGLAVGCLAALVAVLPYAMTTETSVPWRQLGLMLAVVLATGVVTGLLAVQATLRAPLVGALRGE